MHPMPRYFPGVADGALNLHAMPSNQLERHATMCPRHRGSTVCSAKPSSRHLVDRVQRTCNQDSTGCSEKNSGCSEKNTGCSTTKSTVGSAAGAPSNRDDPKSGHAAKSQGTDKESA